MNHKDSAVCQVQCVHEETVREVKQAMIPARTAVELAALFKVLGDSTRVRLLAALSESELCVCDLAAVLAMSSSAVSHQLRVLRAAKLVRFRREGKIVFYSLDDNHVHGLMREGLDHVSHG